ncbi:MAG: hypothetical protein GY859_04185 [Desulfobacterales bacterium]|nr:hypothetical protein [Desulfobacterales bacterium]
MKRATIIGNSRGSIHFALIFALIFTLGVLHGVSLKRSTLAMKMVKSRYWSAAALDLAENGVEFERMLISGGGIAQPGRSPGAHRRELGVFAGYEGVFESSTTALENREYQIVSYGRLFNHKGEVQYAVRIRARIRPDSEGFFETVQWSEETLQSGNRS